MRVADLFDSAFTNAWSSFKFVCVVYCIGLTFESLRPAQTGQPMRDVGFNIVYTMIFLVLTLLLVPPLQAITQPWIATWGLAIPIVFSDNFVGQVGQGLVFLFVYDCFYYWFHRAQHAFPALWAQHRFHHSERSLNITTGNRHHWLEEPLRVFAVLLPIGLLFQQKAVTIVWLWTALTLWGYFIHMNLRLDFGPLTPVLGGPQLHRIHHSNLPQHRDRNFAAFFPILDIAFGTYVAPQRGEYPTTGLADGEDLNSLLRANLSPFRDWFRILRPRREPPVA
jgi:sterol desaturase/sphingolipid hydroxylase (fatty acid hydroxylase superfamily)